MRDLRRVDTSRLKAELAGVRLTRETYEALVKDLRAQELAFESELARRNTMADDELLTVPEVARELRLDVRTVHRYIADSRLDAIKLPVSRQWRIRRTAVEAFLRVDGGQLLIRDPVAQPHKN